MPDEVRIVGTRTFAGEVADFARDTGLDVAALLEPFDPERVGTRIHGLPVEPINQRSRNADAVIIGTGEPSRREIVARVERASWRPVSLIHPRAHLAPSATVGTGAVLAPGVVVGAYSRVGEHTVLGRGALVGHHTEIGPFATLGPGANVAGNVRIEPDAFLGMATAIRDHLTVGAGAVVGMGAVVLSNVATGSEVRGVPARPHRTTT
jgi:sugar O-acyltransferase (sialic acid O-acetyltransferase NeuD family)